MNVPARDMSTYANMSFKLHRWAQALMEDSRIFECLDIPWHEVVLEVLNKCLRLGEFDTYVKVLRHFATGLEDVSLTRLGSHLKHVLTLPQVADADAVVFADIYARLLMLQGDWETVAQLMQHVVPLAKSDTEQARINNRYGVYLMNRALYERSLEVLNLALDAALRTHEHELQAIITNNLGNLAFACDRYNDALAHYETALEIATRMQFPRWQAAAAGGLAMTLETFARYDEAFAYHDKAESYYQQCRFMSGVVRVNINRSYLAAQIGQTARAKEWAARARQLAHERGDLQRKGSALHNLGLAYFKENDYTNAWLALREAYIVRKQMGQPLFLDTTRGLIAQLRNHLQNAPDSAPDQLTELLEEIGKTLWEG
jgi:tetratricopeptide (TPR) repeat protein